MPSKKKSVKPEKSDKELKLKRIREYFKLDSEADHDNRIAALNDMKFVHVPESQWEDGVLNERGLRPHYTYNKTRVTVKRVVNDIRANRPSGKVRGVEETDKDTAETIEGLIRNIWNVSDADTVIDAAAEYQVGGGMGAWRVSVDYADDSAFEQDITIEEIRNPFCLYADAACQDPLKRDARRWFLTSRISKSAYQARWPNAEVVDYEPESEEFDDDDEWEDQDSVRIVEYWYKEPYEREIYLLADGKTVDELPLDPMTGQTAVPVKSRKVKANRIKMCIASGNAILEEADWAGNEFPFVLVYGESVIIDGKHHWFGLTRFAKDAQRAYNYAMTSIIETVALSPQAKYWATPTQAKGHIEKWATAHKELIPTMLYNPDTMAPGAPVPMAAPAVPAASMQIALMSSEDIKATTGIYDASLGKQGNETSGVAINARQEQGEIAVFNYMDNLAKGIRRTWEILIDLIPKIYDTDRAIRILGADGAEKYARVNAVDPATGETVNDLSRGKYDVTVTVGPSYATRRQEAADILQGLAAKDPTMMPLIGDLVFKSMDFQYADQMAKRYNAMLPQPIREMESEGKQLPPEAQQAVMQAQQAMQLVQQQAAELQQASQEVEQGKAEITKQLAALKVQQTEMEAGFTKLSADLTKREAQFILQQANAGADEKGKEVESDRAALSSQVTEASAQLQAQMAEYMQQAQAVMAQIQATAHPQTVITDRPKRKKTLLRKVPGGYEAESIEVPEGLVQ